MIKLLIWITTCCCTAECPIPQYEERYYDTMEQCEIALNAWSVSNPEKHAGVCMEVHNEHRGEAGEGQD